MGALDVDFSDHDLQRIADALPRASGARYPEAMMGSLDG